MCEKDSDNKLEITLNSERTVDVFEHFFSAMSQDGLYILKQDDTTPISDAFRDSKLTFAEVDIRSSENYREMNDDFGIIPCPKYDESVEGYPSLVDASCNLFVVPVSVSDADRVSAVLEALPTAVNTPELHIQLPEGENKRFVQRLHEQLHFDDATGTITIDGIRVEWEDGFALARPSNTTPVVVLRLEGDTPEALERIKARFGQALKDVDPNVQLPFNTPLFSVK